MSSQVDDVEIAPVARVFVRSAYNYDMDFASDASGVACLDETRTQQQYKEETDINTIVKRFGLTGELPNDFAMPQNVDIVEQVSDYHTAMNVVREAGETFMQIPGELRARFQNDPQVLMDFLAVEGNRDEAERLGLLKEKPAVPLAEPFRESTEPSAGASARSDLGKPVGGASTVTT